MIKFIIIAMLGMSAAACVSTNQVKDFINTHKVSGSVQPGDVKVEVSATINNQQPDDKSAPQ